MLGVSIERESDKEAKPGIDAIIKRARSNAASKSSSWPGNDGQQRVFGNHWSSLADSRRGFPKGTPESQLQRLSARHSECKEREASKRSLLTRSFPEHESGSECTVAGQAFRGSLFCWLTVPERIPNSDCPLRPRA